MAKPKIAFTLKKTAGLPDTIIYADASKREMLKFNVLNVYETKETYIITPLTLNELPQLPNLEKYDKLCQAHDKHTEMALAMGRAKPAAVESYLKKSKREGKLPKYSYDEYAKLRDEHRALKKEKTVSVRWLKSKGWNEKEIRKFYKKYGFK